MNQVLVLWKPLGLAAFFRPGNLWTLSTKGQWKMHQPCVLTKTKSSRNVKVIYSHSLRNIEPIAKLQPNNQNWRHPSKNLKKRGHSRNMLASAELWDICLSSKEEGTPLKCVSVCRALRYLLGFTGGVLVVLLKIFYRLYVQLSLW